MFSTISKQENSILTAFYLSSAYAFNLVKTKILSLGKGDQELTLTFVQPEYGELDLVVTIPLQCMCFLGWVGVCMFVCPSIHVDIC